MRKYRYQFAIILVLILSVVIGTEWPFVGGTLLVILVLYQLLLHINSQSTPSHTSVSSYQVADAVMLVDANGIIHDCNKQVLAILGYEQDELIGKSIEILLPADFRKQHVGLRNMFFITSGQRRMQNRVAAVHKKGHPVHIEVYLEFDPSNKGNVICSIRDISKFRQRELELETQLTQIEILRQAGLGIAELTGEGSLEHPNSYFRQFLGFSEHQSSNLLLKDLLHPMDQFLATELNQILDNEDAYQGVHDARLRHQRGHYIWCRIHLSFNRMTGQSAMAMIIEDLSELKALQNQTALAEIELDALLNSQPDQAIWIASPGMTYFIRGNQNFFQVWDCDESVLMSDSKAFLDKVVAEDRKKVMTVYNGHMRSHWQLDYRIDVNGEFKQISETGRSIPAGPDTQGLLICNQRITATQPDVALRS